MKVASTRWQDTINYLNKKFPCPGLANPLGDHIHSLVPGGTSTVSSEQMSLGKRDDDKNDPQYGGTTDKRHALRGLLLCQRVYFSSLWAKMTKNRVEYVPNTDTLMPDWKTQSLSHWGNSNEQEILSAIGMFVPLPNASRDDLVTAAKAGPPDGGKKKSPGIFFSPAAKVAASAPPKPAIAASSPGCCRAALCRCAGFMKDTAPNGKDACDRMFGTGEVVWSPNQPFRPESNIPNVEAGYIVHMWIEQTGIYGWNGHWVINNGDGTICGVNNGLIDTPAEVVRKDYTNNGTLLGQFEGYGGYLMVDWDNKGKLIPKEPKEWARASLVKFDPLTLPNRM